MSNFRVSFYKKADENAEDQKDQYLGMIVVDDYGVDESFSLISKAFRQAPSNYLLSDKVVTERI